MINNQFRLSNLNAPIPILNHDFPMIQYVDDTIVVMEAFQVQVALFKNLITDFADATSLNVNFQKSNMILINCSDELGDGLAHILECQIATMPFTYLGLPLGTTKPTVQDLSPLLDKVGRRLNACSRFLSYAGRLTYIDSMLSALPTFYMCTMKIQKTAIKIIDRGRRHCLWAKREEWEKQAQSLVAWETVCKPKDKGGLGIMNLEIQNDALLLKFMDKFMNKANIPWVDLVWHTYYQGKVPHATAKAGSFWWKDICSLFDQYRGLTSCNIGSGHSVLLWKDKWSNHDPLAHSYDRLFSFALNPDASVMEALQCENLASMFYLPLFVQAFDEMQSLHTNLNELRNNIESGKDQWIYSLNNGVYSPSSYYKFLFEGLPAEIIFKWLWKSKCLPKLKVFAWLMIIDKINTKDMILRRHWHLNSGSECILCHNHMLETRDHLFFTCPFAARCWNYVQIQWLQKENISETFRATKQSFLGPCFMEVVVCATWNIWKERNGHIFQHQNPCFTRWRALFKKDILLTSHRVKFKHKEPLLSWLLSL
jgi:hypothetical protein